MASAAEEYFARSFESNLPGYRSRQLGGSDLLAKTRTALLQALLDVFEIEELTRDCAAECLEIALWEPPA